MIHLIQNGSCLFIGTMFQNTLDDATAVRMCRQDINLHDKNIIHQPYYSSFNYHIQRHSICHVSRFYLLKRVSKGQRIDTLPVHWKSVEWSQSSQKGHFRRPSEWHDCHSDPWSAWRHCRPSVGQCLSVGHTSWLPGLSAPHDNRTFVTTKKWRSWWCCRSASASAPEIRFSTRVL